MMTVGSDACVTTITVNDRMTKIPNSAFVTVGETAASMAKVAAGVWPAAEYSVLRSGYFDAVHAMVDDGLDPASTTVCARFAWQKYTETADLTNIYLGEEFPGIEFLAVHAVRRHRKRIAMLIHNVASKRRSLPLGTLRLASMADTLLCLSSQSKHELEVRYNYPSSRIVVIGSRVDTAFFTPEKNVEVREQVCSAGAINRDYPLLIEAVSPLGLPLKIAADTAWRYTSGASTPLAVPAFVEMRSWGNYVNLRRLYAESAVTVVPLERSLLSGVTVALEAMAMGRPVIMTRNPYIEDFMIDGETGYFVDAGDSIGLRKRIQHILAHPAEAERMGARAREWVLDRFTVDQYVSRIISAWN